MVWAVAKIPSLSSPTVTGSHCGNTGETQSCTVASIGFVLPHAATRSARKGPRSRLSARSALQNALATHLDREHLHNHFLINSVSFVNGKKFNDNKRCYFQMREASDRLCREQELSVIEKPSGHTPRSIYFAEKNGEPTHYNLMREALDEALSMCLEHRDLQLALRDRGYVLNCDPNRKYATIRSIGGGKPVRLYRLGQEYDLPAIEARLAENRRSFWRGGFAIYHRPERAKNKRRYLLLKGSIRALCGKGDLFSLYLHYCYALGILPKNSVRRLLSPELREECRRLDRYDRQTRLLTPAIRRPWRRWKSAAFPESGWRLKRLHSMRSLPR